LRAAENFPLPGGHRDRGIFSVYLLNLVHLLPGQGTFQPAGVLHAYLDQARRCSGTAPYSYLRGRCPQCLRWRVGEQPGTYLSDPGGGV
jgi:hypothetical protein